MKTRKVLGFCLVLLVMLSVSAYAQLVQLRRGLYGSGGAIEIGINPIGNGEYDITVIYGQYARGGETMWQMRGTTVGTRIVCRATSVNTQYLLTLGFSRNEIPSIGDPLTFTIVNNSTFLDESSTRFVWLRAN